MVNPDRVLKLTKAMRTKLRNGLSFEQARNIVFRGLQGIERGEYISAVASQLSFRAHEAEARRLPDTPKQTPPEQAIVPPTEPQLSFEFEKRPPTKRGR